MKVNEEFNIDVARSKSGDDYSSGEVAFVANSQINNGVSGYVEPLPGDKVFAGPAINISGLGYATVQLSEFLPKGNGGDSCTVLTPKSPMSTEALIYYAALFNVLHSWRFSFGRKTSKKRIELLELAPSADQSTIDLEANVKETERLLSNSIKKIENQL